EQRKLLLSVSLPPDDVRVEADPARAQQIVVNLLTNAAKYTEPGGRISITGDREGDEAVIRVRDSGMGIAPEVLPRVFDLFAQSPRALDRSQGGLGLGLTVVQRLVELPGGRVEAHSEGAGRGAEFVVRLQVPPGAPAETAPASPPVESPLPSRARVIVVEDSPDTAES